MDVSKELELVIRNIRLKTNVKESITTSVFYKTDVNRALITSVLW